MSNGYQHKKARKNAEVWWHRQAGRCFWCFEPVPFTALTADHLVPKSQGGDSRVQNIRMACCECNNLRGDMPAADFHRVLAKPSPQSSLKIWLAHIRYRIAQREVMAQDRLHRLVGMRVSP